MRAHNRNHDKPVLGLRGISTEAAPRPLDEADAAMQQAFPLKQEPDQPPAPTSGEQPPWI
jgi:hypothetical protein